MKVIKELFVPWPDRSLHPNARVHWSRRAASAKAARMTGFVLAREAGWRKLKFGDGAIHVWIDGYPADRRRRDADGLLSSLKSTLDGIADSLNIDDRRFVPHPRVRDEVRKGGEVRITIEVEAA